MTDTISIQDLIKAGVHFGHRMSRWNPKMRPYIYGTKNLIHIIDLRHTVRGLVRAATFLARLVAAGREAVFVSTKRQARTIIQREAARCGMHWVTERWLGGTLTNHETIRQRLKRLEFVEKLEATGEIDQYSKKMISSFRRERRKMLRNLDGIRNMIKLPGALVVVDVKHEANAVREANKLGIVVIGIVDTDSDPDGVDIPIPGNDDAFRAIEIMLRPLTDAIIAGRDKRIEEQRMARRQAGIESEPPGEAPGLGEPPAAAPAVGEPLAAAPAERGVPLVPELADDAEGDEEGGGPAGARQR